MQREQQRAIIMDIGGGCKVVEEGIREASSLGSFGAA
jgi:hypothetical protein